MKASKFIDKFLANNGFDSVFIFGDDDNWMVIAHGDIRSKGKVMNRHVTTVSIEHPADLGHEDLFGEDNSVIVLDVSME